MSWAGWLTLGGWVAEKEDLCRNWSLQFLHPS